MVNAVDTITYIGACEKTIHYLCDRVPGLKPIKLQLEYPISDNEILDRTAAALKANKHIKLVLMDAISSLPGVRFPWEKVCRLCRQENIYSLVDAAHAVTQILVDISLAQPDFFVSNLHKWSYVPRGCAVLYVRHALQSLMHAIPIGHGYVSTTQAHVASPVQMSLEGRWVIEHEWPATIDFSNYLSVDSAFEFIEKCGGAENIREYCHQLAVEGGKRAAEILGTEILCCEESELIANMVNVRLPLEVPDESSATHLDDLAVQRECLFDALFERDCTPYPFVMTRKAKEEWWCRFSAQIYLDPADFETCAVILKDICEKMRRNGFSNIAAKQNDETLENQIANIDLISNKAL